MALMLKLAVQQYNFLTNDLSDPRTKDWFLCGSPIPILCIMAIYLASVTKWLPKFMATRPAYNLRKPIIAVNIIQVVSCCLLTIKTIPSLQLLNFSCSLVDYSNDPLAINLAICGWYYYMLKVLDLLDTVFFTLTKKSTHVNFLHVYHHAGMLFTGYMAVTYVSGGESTYVGLINTIVHAVMYSYYLYIAWRPQDRKLIFSFKKFVTQLQLFQFVALFCILTPKLFIDCKYPKILLALFVPQLLLMIKLFGDFYRKTYLRNDLKISVDKVKLNLTENNNSKFK